MAVETGHDVPLFQPEEKTEDSLPTCQKCGRPYGFHSITQRRECVPCMFS